MMDLSRQALIVVDIQEGVVPPPDLNLKRSTPDFEPNVARLLDAFRSAPDAQIIHIRHHSRSEASRLHPSKETAAALPCAAALPSELIVTKSANSAFVGTNLADIIRSKGFTRLVFCGTTTGHCVTTSVRAAADLRVVDHAYGVSGVKNPKPGRIVIVNDATAMYDTELFGKRFDAQLAHEISLACLQGEFADVETTAEVIGKLQLAN